MKLVLLVSVLLGFGAIGIAHVVSPDYFIRRSGVRKGGEMLTEWNRLQFRTIGVIFAIVAGYALYAVLTDYFSY